MYMTWYCYYLSTYQTVLFPWLKTVTLLFPVNGLRDKWLHNYLEIKCSLRIFIVKWLPVDFLMSSVTWLMFVVSASAYASWELWSPVFIIYYKVYSHYMERHRHVTVKSHKKKYISEFFDDDGACTVWIVTFRIARIDL